MRSNALVLAKKSVFICCRKNFTTYLKVKGFALETAARLGFYERRNLLALKRIVSKGDTVIDGGANLGLYTSRLLNLVGPQGRVIAVEPLPFLLSYLKIKLASKPNATLINAALTHVLGANISLHVPHIAPGLMEPALASVQVTKEPKSTFVVSATTLDKLAHDLGSLSFIKLDLEGHELKALQGAARCLLVLRPIIQIEENLMTQNRWQ
jgi:FkbM family methyltransferase